MSGATVASIGEFPLIRRLAEILPAVSGVVGIGDDAAVLPLQLLSQMGLGGPSASITSSSLLVTVDTMVENRHFRQTYCDPFSVGWKLLASSLSDIAAMGGKPVAAVISLSLPAATPLGWVEECYRGLSELAKRETVAIVGGDTVSGGEIALSLTLLGITGTAPCLRSSAKPGDDVWISGKIGDAGAGFISLENARCCRTEYRQRFLRPEPQVRLGAMLGEEKLASAMIDVSDGLLQDLQHVADASGVNLEIIEAQIPLSAAVADGILSVSDACSAGEDYQLVWTAAPSHRERISAMDEVTRIGSVQPVGSDGRGRLFLIAVRNGTAQRMAVQEWLVDQAGTEGPIDGRPARLGFDHFLTRK